MLFSFTGVLSSPTRTQPKGVLEAIWVPLFATVICSCFCAGMQSLPTRATVVHSLSFAWNCDARCSRPGISATSAGDGTSSIASGKDLCTYDGGKVIFVSLSNDVIVNSSIILHGSEADVPWTVVMANVVDFNSCSGI